MCDFTECRKGLHPFKTIARFPVGIGEEKVVRYCPECGAIVVDCDIDGRTMPGYYKKLQYPNITHKYGLGDVEEQQKENALTKIQSFDDLPEDVKKDLRNDVDELLKRMKIS